MNTNPYSEPVLWRKAPVPHHATWWSSVGAEATIEFGRFRMLLRRRQLLADGVPIEIGTRAFDLLLVLLESDGALVTKEELTTGCGRTLLCRTRTSRFRSPPCAKHSARTAISSVRNSGAATGSLACSARMPLRTPAEGPGEQSCGLSRFASAGLPAIAPVWFQFELAAETSTNAHVGYFGAPDRSLN